MKSSGLYFWLVPGPMFCVLIVLLRPGLQVSLESFGLSLYFAILAYLVALPLLRKQRQFESFELAVIPGFDAVAGLIAAPCTLLLVLSALGALDPSAGFVFGSVGRTLHPLKIIIQWPVAVFPFGIIGLELLLFCRYRVKPGLQIRQGEFQYGPGTVVWIYPWMKYDFQIIQLEEKDQAAVF